MAECGYIALGRDAVSDKAERLLSQRQAAEYLNVSIVTLQRWRKRGIGPPSIVLPNGYRRFRKSDLDDWLERHGNNPEE